MEKKRVTGGPNLRTVATDNTSILILAVLLCLCAFFVTNLYTKANLTQLLLEISIYGMLAVGLSLVMLSGSIDLSIGFLMGVTAVVITGVLNVTGSLALAIVLGLLSGAAMGAINGLLVTKVGINPLIATIAMSYIYTGIVNRLTNGSSLRTTNTILHKVYSYKLFGGSFLNITLIVFIVLLVVLGLVLSKTDFGNSTYVSGGNGEAGMLSGIHTNNIRWICYILCGLCCAVAGLFLAARFSGASYTLGAGKDVFAISACVIGGIKMTGGKGTMVNVLFGVIIMRLISTVMNVLFIPSAWTDFVSGLLLLIIIVVDQLSRGLHRAE